MQHFCRSLITALPVNVFLHIQRKCPKQNLICLNRRRQVQIGSWLPCEEINREVSSSSNTAQGTKVKSPRIHCNLRLSAYIFLNPVFIILCWIQYISFKISFVLPPGITRKLQTGGKWSFMIKWLCFFHLWGKNVMEQHYILLFYHYCF